MTGPEHYDLAERCLRLVGERTDLPADQLLAEAQVHATLALQASLSEAIWAVAGVIRGEQE